MAYGMRDTFALSVSQCAIPRAGSAPEVSPSYSRKKYSKLTRAIPCYSMLFQAVPGYSSLFHATHPKLSLGQLFHTISRYFKLYLE